MKTDKIKLNGAQLAVFNSRFEGVVRKMSNTLFRTGRSGVLNRARDFSCCIVTKDCDLLAAAESLPIHVLSGPDMMSKAMHEFHPDLKSGDAYINNSPYHGCSHAADQTILIPVIEDGKHHFTVLAKAHQADIGNSVPTTYYGAARDVYEEGALIFPAMKIQHNYQDIDDIIRMCKMRIRVPEQWYGDYLAALGSARIGEREIIEMGREFGWDTLHAFADQWFDYSEKLMSVSLSVLPKGKIIGTSTHDPFPGTPDTGVPINVRIEIKPEEGVVEVDLTDNMDSLPFGLNLSEACARTSAMVGIFNSIDHTTPKNSGSFRRIKIKLRKGCIVGIPEMPTSCSVATTNIADRVANAVQCAIAELQDGFGMAEVGAVLAPSSSVISGKDYRNGNDYVNQVFLGFTAGAASATQDAWLTVGHVGNAGLCYQDSVELDELYMPLHVYERRIIPDTEGAGKYRGAPSYYCEFGPIGGSFEVGYVSDGNINGPKGVRGGQTGGNSDQLIRRLNNSVEKLPACAQVTVQENERIISISTGGGGYGDPMQRDPERVLSDYLNGYITKERSKTTYGVVITEENEIDNYETAHIRSE
ncbi:MAG: hydantoinase [Alphaproteobacteria bacterium]|nr:MAG: hydantoinase [Alphaproteobacteria bacterium]